MFKIIKNFNWIILSSFLCIFMGIVTFLTFINEGFVPLNDRNLQNLLIGHRLQRGSFGLQIKAPNSIVASTKSEFLFEKNNARKTT